MLGAENFALRSEAKWRFDQNPNLCSGVPFDQPDPFQASEIFLRLAGRQIFGCGDLVWRKLLVREFREIGEGEKPRQL